MNTIDIENLIDPDNLAVDIADKWRLWHQLRNSWMEGTKELRNYVYATDTTTTANAILPWSNTTTTPKITQIADNLHANYFATLFPQQKWMKWEADTRDSARKEKREIIQSYMDNTVSQSGFVTTVSDIIQDWILYGNCFGMVEWHDGFTTKETGEYIPKYVGPKLVRISPYDICFNPTASSFEDSPKIIKSIKSLGEIKRMIDSDPNNEYLQGVFEKMMSARKNVRGTDGHFDKAEGFIADGFTSIEQYYESDYVEIMTFYGDIYDQMSGELMADRVITIVDRAHVLDNQENPSWMGKAPIFHSGWRNRPDNLYAMGPLDNLVGMQYRIDHLENLKADVFDQIAYPILKVKGDVEDFDFEPGARIYMGEEGDVGYMAPDATALNADLQIQVLENKMEEMAGAPRQAMGIRTPGEKTAFEVQTLQNSASRIFEHKAAHFERTFIEPILNTMLENARRYMNRSDTIRVLDEDQGFMKFLDITREDITSSGKIVPVGARHFAERARRLQNLLQMAAVKAQDPTVAPHLSGKELARIIAYELGEPTLFADNVAIDEQMETQSKVQDLQAANEERLMEASEMGL